MILLFTKSDRYILIANHQMTNDSNFSPIIENATGADITAISDIYGEAVKFGKASFEWQAPDETEMTRRFHNLVDNNFPYIVARVNKSVAGYAYAGPYRSRIGYQWTVENTVYVNPNFQNLGLGSMLLERIIQECVDKNFRQMIAIIGDSANYGSIRLHEKFGFTHIGTLSGVGRKHEKWLDSVIMQRQLGNGSSEPPA